MKLAPLLLLALVACAPSADEQRRIDLARYEGMAREMRADIIRSEAECRATEIELNEAPQVIEICWQIHKAMADNLKMMIEDAERQAARIKAGR